MGHTRHFLGAAVVKILTVFGCGWADLDEAAVPAIPVRVFAGQLVISRRLTALDVVHLVAFIRPLAWAWAEWPRYLFSIVLGLQHQVDAHIFATARASLMGHTRHFLGAAVVKILTVFGCGWADLDEAAVPAIPVRVFAGQLVISRRLAALDLIFLVVGICLFAGAGAESPWVLIAIGCCGHLDVDTDTVSWWWWCCRCFGASLKAILSVLLLEELVMRPEVINWATRPFVGHGVWSGVWWKYVVHESSDALAIVTIWINPWISVSPVFKVMVHPKVVTSFMNNSQCSQEIIFISVIGLIPVDACSCHSVAGTYSKAVVPTTIGYPI